MLSHSQSCWSFMRHAEFELGRTAPGHDDDDLTSSLPADSGTLTLGLDPLRQAEGDRQFP